MVINSSAFNLKEKISRYALEHSVDELYYIWSNKKNSWYFIETICRRDHIIIFHECNVIRLLTISKYYIHIYKYKHTILCEEVWNIIINNFIFIHNSELYGNDCGDGIIKEYVCLYTIILNSPV